MKYKTLITEKLEQLLNIKNGMDSAASRDNGIQYSEASNKLAEKIEEIQTLINSQTADYEH